MQQPFPRPIVYVKPLRQLEVRLPAAQLCGGVPIQLKGREELILHTSGRWCQLLGKPPPPP
jgi:hypothetical protein